MKFISYILVAYFFILSLAPNMQGAQFLNLNNFIEHYQEHLEQNENANLFSFVKEHYFNRLNEFEKDHRNLPLKLNIQVSTAVLKCDNVNIKFITEESYDFNELSVKNESFKKSFYNKNFHSIWQPPQIS